MMFIGNHYNLRYLGLIKKHPFIYVPLISFFYGDHYFAILATRLFRRIRILSLVFNPAPACMKCRPSPGPNIIDDQTRFILESEMMLKAENARGRFT
jgi:hypothetical protein